MQQIIEEIDKKIATTHKMIALNPQDKLGRISNEVVEAIIAAYEECKEIVKTVTKLHGFVWTPVTERLPEDGTYLCTLDGELYGLEEPFTGICGINDGQWDEEDCVISWMRLPKPYKPEQDN